MRQTYYRTLRIVIPLICLFYFIISLIYKPIVCNDAVNGMLSLHNYLAGDKWNSVWLVDANGALHAGPSSWWAPGQYEIPYLVSKLSGLSIGTAISTILFLATVGGCYFYYKVFQLSSVDRNITLTALVILLLQRFINIFYIQYNSPDLLLFFLVPFYLWTYLRLLKNPDKSLFLKLILLFLLNLAGLFVKNSFAIFSLTFNFFLLIDWFSKKSNAVLQFQRPAFIKTVLIMAPFLMATGLNYWFFLRLGANPTNGGGILLTINNILSAICLPAMQVLFASLSLYGIYGIFWGHSNISPIIADAAMAISLVLMALFIFKAKGIIKQYFKSDMIFRFTTIAALAYVFFWCCFTLKQSAISNEDRLFLPVTIFGLPYLLRFAWQSAHKIKYLYLGFITCSVLYGVSSFYLRIDKYTRQGSVFSQDENLNGFKVYSTDHGNEPDLQKISSYISSHCAEEFVRVPYPDLAFQLNVKNKFIANASPVILKNALNNTVRAVIITNVDEDLETKGFKKVFTAGMFAVYQ